MAVVLCVLGATRLTDGDRVLTSDFGGVKPRQIIEILALRQGEPVSKERLSELLWEGNPPTSSTATLESHVSVARRHLVRNGLSKNVLRTVHGGYVLDDEVEVDLVRARRELRESTTSGVVEDRHLLWGAPLLASSPYASWAIAAREEFDRERAEWLRIGARRALDTGSLGVAVALARRAQLAEPVSEASVQVLMEALAASGARADALVAFAAFRQRVRDELGVEPSASTHRLYLEMLTGDDLEQLSGSRERALLHWLLEQVEENAVAAAPGSVVAA